MRGLVLLGVFVLLGLFGGKCLATDYCVWNYGAGITTQGCYPSLAEAESHLRSGDGKLVDFADYDSTWWETSGFWVSPNGTSTSFGFKAIAPPFDRGERWSFQSDQGGECCYATEQAAYDAAVQLTGYTSLQLGTDTPAEETVYRTGNTTNIPGGRWRTEVARVLSQKIYWQGGNWVSIGGFHFWDCPDTHNAEDRSTLAAACKRMPDNAQIFVAGGAIKSCATCRVGNPVRPQTGVKLQEEVDFTWDGLRFERTFSSSPEVELRSPLGPRWSPFWSVRLQYQDLPGGVLYQTAIDGAIDLYRSQPDGWYYSTQQPGTRLRFATQLQAEIQQSSGRTLILENHNSAWRIQRIQDRDTGVSFDFTYCDATLDGSCNAGNLLRITSSHGRILDLVYGDILDATGEPYANRLLGVAADGTVMATFNYSTAGLLAGVTYPGSPNTSRAYRYNEIGRICVNAAGSPLNPCYLSPAQPLLTSIQDENGIEYAIFRYDNTARAVSSEHIGGADKVSIAYNSELSSSVTDANGKVTTYTSTISNSVYRLSSIAFGGLATTFTYDGNGFRDLVTDRAGVVSDYDFDVSGRLANITLAKGKPEQQIRTLEWDTTANRPSTATRQGQSISETYNSRGQRLASTTTDLTISPNPTRTVSRTYCESGDVSLGLCPRVGLLRSVDGSRTDVSDFTTYTYYSDDDPGCATGSSCTHRVGDLKQVSNAAGQTTEYLAYDSAGRLASVKDANGLVTDLEYSPRGLLAAIKARGADDQSETDDAITRLEYDGVGQVTRTIASDGASLSFAYYPARRLKDVTDTLDNKLKYSVNAAGLRTLETAEDPSGVLRRTLSRVFNTLGQMQTFKDANQKSTSYTFDATGAVNTVTDPLSRVSDNDMDGLGRLIQVISNVNKKAVAQATVKYSYDSRDNLLSVVDPKGLTTSFGYDGFDELRQSSSPDTGTYTIEYDSGGNRSRDTDARGAITDYTYDNLNRMISRSGPTSDQRTYFDYDVATQDCPVAEVHHAGRLAQSRDQTTSNRYCYDVRGRLVREIQSIVGGSTLTTGTSYGLSGRVSAVSYPSGATVVYLRDLNGRVKRIDVVPASGSPQSILVSSATYLPFGPMKSITFGNGRVLNKIFDLNYNVDVVSDSRSDGLSNDFTVDGVGNATNVSERTSATATTSRVLTYDGLDRLVSRKNGSTSVEAFSYDTTGNRLSKSVGGTATTYSYPGASHRLSATGTVARTYDLAGNTVQIGSGATATTFLYDDFGRLREFKLGTLTKATYRYDGRGRRVLRNDTVNPANSRQFVYNEAGQLLGEYTSGGQRVQEFIWLDDTLVGVISDHDGSAFQYVETDHLGSARAVIQPSNDKIIWRWNVNDTGFGDHAPLVDPDSNGIGYTLAMRYPGQYVDPISGMNYNYFRDYDPGTGRYLESDPMGLFAGMATYAYADGRPNTRRDTFGLSASVLAPPEKGIYAGVLGNQDLAVVPGDPLLEPAEANATATTIMEYVIDPTCKPISDGSGDYEYAGSLTFGFRFPIYKRASGLSGYEDEDEQNHVDNFRDWALHSAPEIIARVEKNMGDCTGTSEPDCKQNARDRLIENLEPSAAAAAAASKKYWDDDPPYRHTHHDIKGAH